MALARTAVEGKVVVPERMALDSVGMQLECMAVRWEHKEAVAVLAPLVAEAEWAPVPALEEAAEVLWLQAEWAEEYVQLMGNRQPLIHTSGAGGGGGGGAHSGGAAGYWSGTKDGRKNAHGGRPGGSRPIAGGGGGSGGGAGSTPGA